MSQLLPCTSFQGTRATCVLRWNGDAYDGSRGRILIQVIGILPVEIETIKMLKQLTRKSFSLGCNNRIIGCSVHNKVMIREPCIRENKIKKKARVRKGGGGGNHPGCRWRANRNESWWRRPRESPKAASDPGHGRSPFLRRKGLPFLSPLPLPLQSIPPTPIPLLWVTVAGMVICLYLETSL